jgi:hypothetical protein
MQTEQYRLLRDKMNPDTHVKQKIALEQLLMPTRQRAYKVDSLTTSATERDIPDAALPTGQGESFKPGEWTPTAKAKQ